jgi:AraC-like DNA-binding protein
MCTGSSFIYHIADAARSLGVSVRSLQRWLADRGLTYSQFLDSYASRRRQIMLGSTEWKLDAVAREWGYQHGTHFSRAFRHVCGVSPSAYRAARLIH